MVAAEGQGNIVGDHSGRGYALNAIVQKASQQDAEEGIAEVEDKVGGQSYVCPLDVDKPSLDHEVGQSRWRTVNTGLEVGQGTIERCLVGNMQEAEEQLRQRPAEEAEQASEDTANRKPAQSASRELLAVLGAVGLGSDTPEAHAKEVEDEQERIVGRQRKGKGGDVARLVEVADNHGVHKAQKRRRELREDAWPCEGKDATEGLLEGWSLLLHCHGAWRL